MKFALELPKLQSVKLLSIVGVLTLSPWLKPSRHASQSKKITQNASKPMANRFSAYLETLKIFATFTKIFSFHRSSYCGMAKPGPNHY